MKDIKLALVNIENRSNDELCDIYWNIADNVWDRRIGRKPIEFDSLPNYSKRFKKKSKSKLLEPYLKKIEQLTTEKERRKYLMVVIQKCINEENFEEWWENLSKLRY